LHASQGGPAIGGAGEPSELAGRPLAGLIDRWDPTREVATHARSVVPAVPDEDRRLLVDAAWLHDIGYSRRCTGQDFIPWTAPGTSCRSELPRTWWEPWGNHSCARSEAEERGLASELATFLAPWEALMDACADMTTGPTGRGVSVEDPLAEILER